MNPVPTQPAPAYPDLRLLRRARRGALRGDEVAALQQGPLFRLLPEAVQQEVLQVATVQRLAHADLVCAAGDAPEHWIVCASGAIRLDCLPARGRSHVLTYVEPGDWHGDISMYARDAWSHDAYAHGATTLLLIGRDCFRGLLLRQPVFRDVLMRAQARKLQALSDTYDDLRTLSLRARLAKLLGYLSRDVGEGLRLRLQQDEIARWLHASRQRVNLELKQLEREGLVRLSRAGVAVIDRIGLAEVPAQEPAEGLPADASPSTFSRALPRMASPFHHRD